MPSYWKSAVSGIYAESELIKLFKILRIAKDKIGLNYHAIQGETIYSDISLNERLKLKILAPTSNELDEYAKNYEIPPFEEEFGNRPSANWLATLIKIYCDDWFILLTSDIEDKVLYYYDQKKPEELKGKLILAQSPHHGAARNHNSTFWRKIRSNDNTPIVISVGKNDYGHPSKNAVNFFNKNNFKIFSTNQVGSLETLAVPQKNHTVSLHLDIFSSIVNLVTDQYNGDKIFDISSEGKIKASN